MAFPGPLEEGELIMARLMQNMTSTASRPRGGRPTFRAVVTSVLEAHPGLPVSDLITPLTEEWRKTNRAYSKDMLALRLSQHLREMELKGQASRSIINGETRWWPGLGEEGGVA
jgi:hypothetical protein